MKKAVILGGGVTGLRVGEYLANAGFEVNIIERKNYLGGLSASFKYKDFILDYGPHKFYTQLPGVYDEFKKIVGENNYLVVKKKNSLRLLDKYFDFPVRLSQLMMNINPILASEIMIDFIKAQLTKKKAISYEDYFINGFGKKGYSLLFEGFAEKVWGNPKEISEELARKRSPVSNIFDVIKTALIKNDKNVSAEYFYYPKKGINVLCENLSSKILQKNGKIFLESEAINIETKKGFVKLVSIKEKNKIKKIDCDVLVSTIPIKELPMLISPVLSKEVLEASKKLKERSLIISYILIKKERALKDNWIFFPEKEFCFNRVSEQKSFSSLTGPKDKTVITAEIPCDPDNEIYKAPDKFIKPIVIKDLEKAGILKAEEVYDFFTKKVDYVYPVYEIGYKDNLNLILEGLDKIKNLFTTGRMGLFNYNNIDHCLDMAKITSEIIIGEKGADEWKKARKYFDNYRIVD